MVGLKLSRIKSGLVLAPVPLFISLVRSAATFVLAIAQQILLLDGTGKFPVGLTGLA